MKNDAPQPKNVVKMAEKQKKCVHEGHRKRLIELISNSEFDNMDDIKKVETFLYFILPRVDTNPLAHRLLDKFENFANIVEADEAELQSVKGLGDLTAKKIKLFCQFFLYYAELKVTDKKMTLDNNEKFLKFLEGLMRFRATENLYLFGFDHKFKLISKRKFNLNLVSEIGISPAEIFAFISSCHAKYIIFSHNHPGGTARPSKNDLDAADYLKNLCESWDCDFLDSMIIGEDGIYSTDKDAFLVNFEDNCKIFNIN